MQPTVAIVVWLIVDKAETICGLLSTKIYTRHYGLVIQTECLNEPVWLLVGKDMATCITVLIDPFRNARNALTRPPENCDASHVVLTYAISIRP